jgi:protein-tyrosine phosphatase
MTIGVLFVCTANICRSPMAEGVFRSMAGRAGLDAGHSQLVKSSGRRAGAHLDPPSRRPPSGGRSKATTRAL